MKTRIAINGFWPYRAAMLCAPFMNPAHHIDIVAINDLGSVETQRPRLRLDSVPRQVPQNRSEVDATRIRHEAANSSRFFAERGPGESLPLGRSCIDIVMNDTGIFHAREKGSVHL